MPVINLNRATVAMLTLPEGKRFELFWDQQLKGFGHQIRRDTRDMIQRSWIIQYRFGGQQRKIKLGEAQVF
jgi:hypothetical protein